MPRKPRVSKARSTEGKPRVVGYVRVSTEEQSREGTSLTLQEERIRGYCGLYGLDLVAIERDAGVSAKTLERPGLGVVMHQLAQWKVDGVVIMKMDRLTRSLGDWDYLIKAFFSEDAGRRLFSVNDSIDTRTPSGRMVLNMIMTVAQWEREEISYRTKNALQGKIGRGERCGKLRFGYQLDADGKSLIPDPAEQSVIRQMKEWRARGYTYQEMVGQLEQLGIETKEGNRLWLPATIHRILHRPIA